MNFLFWVLLDVEENLGPTFLYISIPAREVDVEGYL